MLRVTIRGIRAQLGRSLLTVLAVALGISFLSGTLALRAVLGNTFSELVANVVTSDLVVVGPVKETKADKTVVRGEIDASMVEDVRKVPGIEFAYAGYGGTGTLLGPDGEAANGTSGAPTIISAKHPTESVPRLVKGENPANADQICLESSGLKRTGLKIGDKVELLIAGHFFPKKIVCEYGYKTGMAGAIVAFVTPNEAQTLFGKSGKVPQLVAYAKKGQNIENLRDEVAKKIGSRADVLTRDAFSEEQSVQINNQLGFISTFLLVFVALALFVGTFIISNTFQMSVRARQREFALLRAIGAGTGQVFAVVSLQALVIGVLGSVLGLLLGSGLLAAITALLSKTGLDLPGGVNITLGVLIWSFVIGIGVTLLSALLPARKAALTAPVEAMREVAGANEKTPWLRTILGILVTILGIGMLGASTLEWTTQRGPALGAGVAGLVLGVLLLSPMLCRPILFLAAAPFRVLRPMGRLALRNAVRSPKRIANTAGALMIGVALVVAGATLAASAKASTATVVGQQLKADLLVQGIDGYSPVPRAVLDAIAKIKDVRGVNSYEVGTAKVKYGAKDAEETQVVSLDQQKVLQDLRIPVEAGKLESLNSGQVAVQKAAAKAAGIKVGDKIEVTAGSGKTVMTVGAIVDARLLKFPYLVSPQTFADLKIQTIPLAPAATISFRSGVDKAQVSAKIKEVLKPYKIYAALDKDEFSSALAKQIDIVLGVLYALLGLSVVIAILGIVNTLTLSVAERTREIGLMRAIGLGKTQMAATLTIEAILTAVFGATLGVAVGLVSSVALYGYMRDIGLEILQIPWDQVGYMFVAALIVGALAALLPTLRALRFPVLEAVSQE